MFRFKFIVVIYFISSIAINAQNTYLPINNFTNLYTDRLDITGDSKIIITSLKPYLRNDIYNSILSDNKTYKKLYKYIANDNFELSKNDSSNSNVVNNFKSFKKQFYLHKSAFYAVNKKDFVFILNPVLGFGGGYDYKSKNSTFQNSRGLEIRGNIDNKIGFYSFITENQYRFPNFFNSIIDSSGAIPGNGYHKPFGNGAYDFFQARGYITFSATKHILMQFGHDKNFIGNGYRSLILSDFSNQYLFLKVNTRYKLFNYQNLYTQLTDYNFISGSGSSDFSKYFVNHYLGLAFPCNLNIGFFESVIYNRSDSLSKGNFEINYLNPVIFYRAIEHNLNSKDNVMVGADWKWNFKKRFSFYGQIVFDEFIKNEMVKHTRSWVNKFGVQTGIKYFNAFGLNNFDLQAEYNLIRPYMYTHFKRSQNFINYNQPLAHPLGANFKEMIFIAKYYPNYKMLIEIGLINAIKGLDSSSKSKHFGGNILADYKNRSKDTGLKIGDGVKTNYSIFFINASYMIFHNIWFDAKILLRKVESSLKVFENNSMLFQFGFRMNLSQTDINF